MTEDTYMRTEFAAEIERGCVGTIDPTYLTPAERAWLVAHGVCTGDGATCSTTLQTTV